MRRLFSWLVWLGMTMSLSSGVARAASARIPLLRETVVNGEAIYLSDLLPQSAPSRVRIPAQEVLVGHSPQPGSTRVLSNDAMIRLLTGGNLLSELQIPEQIVVRRSGRSITKDEITEAIQTVLRRNEAFNNVQIARDDVRFSADILVSAANPELRVTRIDVDPTLREMRFWVVSEADPAILPFMVTARPEGGFDELAGAPADTPVAASGAEGTIPARTVVQTAMGIQGAFSSLPPAPTVQKPVTIVEIGKLVQLHLVSGTTSEMFLTATALERGAFGQRIRVKLQATGRVLEAQVTGRGRLEAEY